MMADLSRQLLKILISVYLLSFCTLVVLGGIDPYATLGVSRTASQKEVKKSYKQLAREWHPDKNSDPGAGDRFIEIQHAYEILSDESKRAHYDQYGYEDESGGFEQRGNNNMFRGFHFSGGSYSFKFSSGGGQRSQASRVTLRKYQTQILPESFSKPYLLLLTGEWCFSCMRVESVWEQIKSELEETGIGVGTVNEDYDYNLVRQIGIFKKPAVIAVIQESVYKYSGNEFSFEHLKKFVADLLPSYIISRVNDANREWFLSQFSSLNKPSVLLFTRRSTPSVLYKLLALKFHEKINFGFVQTTDTQSKDTISDFEVQSNQRELLIFKENIKSPAKKLEISQIETDELSGFLSSNQYLYAPRLSSQSLYEELCPETPYSHSKSYCVILCLNQDQELNQVHESFITVSMTSSHFSDKYKVKFAYLVAEKQSEFTSKLNPPEPAAGTLSVVVLWRIDGRRAHLKWLPEGWHQDKLDADKNNLVEFLASVQWTKARELPELKDEFAPSAFTRLFHSLKNKFKGWFQSVWDLFAYGSLNEVSVIMMVALIYLFCLVLVFFGVIIPPKQGAGETEDRNQNEREGQREGSRQHREGDVRLRRDPDSSDNSGLRQRSNRTVQLKCLNPSTYDELIRDPPKNNILLILLVTDETKSGLFNLFQKEVYNHSVQDRILSFCYLSLNSHLTWCNKLLGKRCSSDQLTGTVLAVRPAKNYYSVFSPRGVTTDEGDQLFELDELKLSLDGLNMWLDRLLDGGLTKTTVAEWPEMKDDDM